MLNIQKRKLCVFWESSDQYLSALKNALIGVCMTWRPFTSTLNKPALPVKLFHWRLLHNVSFVWHSHTTITDTTCVLSKVLQGCLAVRLTPTGGPCWTIFVRLFGGLYWKKTRWCRLLFLLMQNLNERKQFNVTQVHSIG